jgi:phospholipase C
VSWVLTSIADAEHPDYSSPQAGEQAARQVIEAIISNPKVWQKIETRFGVRVPNLSRSRRRVTGDLTSAFNFAAAPKFGRPPLAKPGGGSTACSPATSLPVSSTAGPFPRQLAGKRRRPSGIVRR